VLYYRLWNDAYGESHLDELVAGFSVTPDYARGVPPVGTSTAIDAHLTHFLRLPRGWRGDFHPVPRRQYVIQAQGSLEVTTSDGSTVTTGPGTVWLVEDTYGKGHRTTVLGEEDAISFVVTLE
jgi:hypothetical protein